MEADYGKLILFCIIGFIIIATIVLMPVINLYRLIRAFIRRGFKVNRILSCGIDIICTLMLPFLSISNFLHSISGKEPLTIRGSEYINFHTPLAHEHLLTVYGIMLFSVISYWILRFFSEKLSPILYLVFSSGVLLEIIFIIFLFIQIKFNFQWTETIILNYSFINLIFIYISLFKEKFDEFLTKEEGLNRFYENKLIMKLYSFMIKVSTLPLVISIAVFPILIMIQLFLTIFGQQPDSIIKAFVETSDWTFSRLQAPPPIVLPSSEGHYLCTVSLKGHKALVKPIRYGVRNNLVITVNRQLQIANAFENVLEQYTPKLHKVIRNFYDKYGLPISKYINQPLTADFIYIMMKPLEWVFILVLYLVDKNPENRIAVQYLPGKERLLH